MKVSEKIVQLKNQKSLVDIKRFWPEMVIFAVLVFLTVDRIHYVLGATANVPMMDYWSYIVGYVEAFCEHNLSYIDLFRPASGVAYDGIVLPLFLLNIKFFSLNTQVEIVLGAIGALANCCFLYWMFLKWKWETKWIKCGFVFMALCIFNINQWEILTLEFAFAFSLRMLLTLWTFCVFDSLKIETNSKKRVVGTCVCMLFLPIFVGIYATAIFATFCFNLCAQFVMEKKRNYSKLMATLSFLMGIIVFQGSTVSTAGEGAFEVLWGMITDGSLIKGIFLMLGGSVLHMESSMALEHPKVRMLLGIIIFFMYITAVFLFFKRKMYKSYLPIMLIVYAASMILIFEYGRIPVFGLDYVLSSRYVCETTLGLVGVSWILIGEIQYLYTQQGLANLKKRIKSGCGMALCGMGLILFLSSLLYSYRVEKRIAPYRKNHYENLILLMREDREISEEEAGLFQAGWDTVNTGMGLLKKYHLGIFKDRE